MTPIVRMINPDDFITSLMKIEALGNTPGILAKVNQLVRSPDTEIQNICDVIKHDQSLTADIIRISNSPFYAPYIPHTNLVSAVNAIGMHETLRAIKWSMSRHFLARDLDSYGLSAEDNWRYSVFAALLMESFAKCLKLNPKDAYTIGILHAIGFILIQQVIEDNGVIVRWDQSQSLGDWERSMVGFDHAEAGVLLLDRWHFSEEICFIIGSQLKDLEPDRPSQMLFALQFVVRLACKTQFFRNLQLTEPLKDDVFLLEYPMSQELLLGLLHSTQEAVTKLEQSLNG